MFSRHVLAGCKGPDGTQRISFSSRVKRGTLFSHRLKSLLANAISRFSKFYKNFWGFCLDGTLLLNLRKSAASQGFPEHFENIQRVLKNF